MSRWLVGSSSSSASGCIRRMRASATRIFQPPESSADVALDDVGREAEPGEDLARARLEAVAAELVEARLHLAEARDEAVDLVGPRRVGHRVLELVQLVRDRRDLARAGHRLLEHAPAAHLADRLGEVADADATLDEHAAGVRLLLADDHAEDGRLAGAVGADEPDLLAAEDAPWTRRGRGCGPRAAWRWSRDGSCGGERDAYASVMRGFSGCGR